MDDKWKRESEEVLDKLVKDAKNSQLVGSGDDVFYFKQPLEYVNKQRKFWIEYGMRIFNLAEERHNLMLKGLKTIESGTIKVLEKKISSLKDKLEQNHEQIRKIFTYEKIEWIMRAYLPATRKSRFNVLMKELKKETEKHG